MSPEPTGVVFTRTATAAAAVQKTWRGLGDQPRLLAQSIMARPRQHRVIDTYMITLAARLFRCRAPRSRATDVSGRSTGAVATLGWGAVAHSPLTAMPARPSALSSTAGSGRARGLCGRNRMTGPMRASTRPPVSGGSASLGSVSPVSAGSPSGGSASSASGSGGGSVMTGEPGTASVSTEASAGTLAEGRSSALSRDGGSTNKAIDHPPGTGTLSGRTHPLPLTSKTPPSPAILLRDLAGALV